MGSNEIRATSRVSGIRRPPTLPLGPALSTSFTVLLTARVITAPATDAAFTARSAP
ncbi:hypothetical protein [Streptomyces cyaneofuscatus]|uniref:hypothetical protein n=1 Tax=Streptomyces cyaneofuscatus TaxID=66883 RepID=UPI0033BC8161